jgi:hypothetical protein
VSYLTPIEYNFIVEEKKGTVKSLFSNPNNVGSMSNIRI